jgi:glycosyltransferase involved in cell wall biosynthesis
MRGRPAVLMICAHEPGLDPRIRWEAEAAAGRFGVTVLGFNRDDGSLARSERVAGYQIVRLARRKVSGVSYFWRLKDILPITVYVPLGALLLPTLPLLVFCELLGRLLRGSVRRAARDVAVSSPLRGVRFSSLLGRIRGQALMRLDYILTALRLQFAPATRVFWKHLRNAPDKPDIVHCNDLDTLLVGVLAKLHYGCRLVYDAHEFYPVSDPHGKWLDITFFSLVERLLIRHADAVVSVNPLLGEAMRAAYRLDRVHSVPNAEPWAPGRAPPPGSEMAKIAQGRVRFLFQGRFTPGRGIDELIEGWAQIDAGRAALFLRGPDNMWRQAAIEHAARLGLLDRGIYFLDAVGEDDLVSAAAEADVGIIPYKPLILNDRLSCPNKLSQYLHAGLVVLANDLPYVQSVLSEAEAGVFYSSADLRTLGDAVGRILDDPAVLRQGRLSALRFARETFNWQIQSETLYALYQGDEAHEAAAPCLAGMAPLPSA